MKNKKFLSLLAATATLASAQVGYAVTLADVTGNYDLLVEGNLTLPAGHLHGATAVGGDVLLTGQKVDFSANETANPIGLLVKGEVQLNGNDNAAQVGGGKLFRVENLGTVPSQDIVGNKLTQGSKFLEFDGNIQSKPDVLTPVPFDLAASFAAAEEVSNYFISGVGNALNFGDLLSGSKLEIDFDLLSVGLNVLTVTVPQLNLVNEIDFSNLSAGLKQLVFNVDLGGAANSTFSVKGIGSEDSNGSSILWNIFNGDAVTMSLEDKLNGSILSTSTDLTIAGNGDLHGTVVAQSFNFASGKQHHVMNFEYEIPNTKVPDSGATLMLALLGGLPLFLLARRRSRA